MVFATKRATKEDVRARYHGLHDHARSVGIEAAWLGLQGVALAVLGGVLSADPGTKAAAFAGAVVLIGAAVGIARAAEWARWVGGVASLLLGVASLALPHLRATEGVEPESPKYFFAGLAFATGAYLLLPSTRVSFLRAREARDRARAAKAGT